MARAPREGFTASLRSACFHRYGHFVINLKDTRLVSFLLFGEWI
ncbi:gluconate 5-dehydrogenase [Yersinia enterocolitica]|nr:gluconate 5-dehydrogenase [Yersinia enterocolitica]PNM16750.1 gluconate 5-dehydrogenase [Yersinia enterocolitica]PNM17955.1 gluconate 5-dehydrogenase [Yersinia enterocolitica]